jgi:cell filamentation protein
MSEDPYVYPGTDVLKNAFDMRDNELLAKRERAMTSHIIKAMQTDPVRGDFDAAHYRAIHRRIFQDIYPVFAGQDRVVSLYKQEFVLQGRSVAYGHPAEIAASLSAELKAELRGVNAEVKSSRADLRFWIAGLVIIAMTSVFTWFASAWYFGRLPASPAPANITAPPAP